MVHSLYLRLNGSFKKGILDKSRNNETNSREFLASGALAGGGLMLSLQSLSHAPDADKVGVKCTGDYAVMKLKKHEALTSAASLRRTLRAGWQSA